VNESLTLLFDDDVEAFESHHYGFHVDDAEFDAVLQRLQANLPEFGAAGDLRREDERFTFAGEDNGRFRRGRSSSDQRGP
jgi:hypothetical protein